MSRTEFLASISRLERVRENFPDLFNSAKSLAGTVAKTSRVTARQIERLIRLQCLAGVTVHENFGGPINQWATRLKQINFS